MNTKKSLFALIPCLLALVSTNVFSVLETFAEDTRISLSSKSYQFSGENSFGFDVASPKQENLVYGPKSSGNFYLNGNIDQTTTFRGVDAYSTTDSVTFSYNLTDSKIIANNENDWSTSSSSAVWVGDVCLNSQVGNGVLIVEKSTNNYVWEIDSITTDVFSANRNNFYTTKNEDLNSGIFYRIVLAYQLKHKVGEHKAWDWWPFISHMENDYEYYCFAETTELFLCNNNYNLRLNELLSRESLENANDTDYGFRIDKNKSTNLVEVRKPDGSLISCNQGSTFTDKGHYSIYETSKLGFVNQFDIDVTVGLTKKSVNNSVYEMDDNTGYNATPNKLISRKSYSNLNVAVPTDSEIAQNAGLYGVTGSEVYFLFSLNSSALPSGFNVDSDTWGTYENEFTNGKFTGRIDSGALILEKSTNGVDWSLAESGMYEHGIFTTDYQNSFGVEGENLIYTPSGEEVINGVYYRISYFYEINDGSSYKNIAEIYEFKLMSNEINAVVFHNLSVEEKIDDMVGGLEESYIDIVKKSETLVNNSVTLTGFSIDKSLNPNVDISVLKNGEIYVVPENNRITDEGRYDITVTTPFDKQKTLTIYVLKTSPENLLNVYFGSGFIQGKRIFSKDSVPVFEGGKSSYFFSETSNCYPRLNGKLVNLTTGNEIVLSTNDGFNGDILNEPGLYQTSLNVNKTYLSDDVYGDNISFTFNFQLILEGTAPGPQINQENLGIFMSNNNFSNSKPVYYGITFSSAFKGYITLAFASEKEAFDYAYQYMKGMVEIQPDGSFRYDGDINLSQKVKYDSLWDLTDAVNYFAKQAITKLYFDANDGFTYQTLEQEIIDQTENLRTLELYKSVVVFGPNQDKKLIDDSYQAPLINSKKYSYIVPGQEENIKQGVYSFKFIKDENGYDSNKVSVVGKDGNEHPLAYDTDVESQFVNLGFDSGFYTIKEETVYGDATSYQVGYIKKDDNTANVNLISFNDKLQENLTINKLDQDKCFDLDAFVLSSVTDELDSNGLVFVKYAGQEEFYSYEEAKNLSFTKAGLYEIKIQNRYGYSFSFKINIAEEKYSSVTIQGEESFPLLYDLDGNVTLPVQERYGYNFIGYKTDSGLVVSGEIAAIMIKGATILKPIWEAKKFNLTFFVDGAVYQNQEIVFDETYSLPVLENTAEREFIGWVDENGNYVEEINVKTEENIELRAKFRDIGTTDEDIETPDEDVDTEDPVSEDKDDGFPTWLIIVLSIVAFIIVIFVISMFI